MVPRSYKQPNATSPMPSRMRARQSFAAVWRFCVPDDGELLSFNSRSEWRSWLASNHDQASEARIVIYKNGPRKACLSLNEAQEEALCFGWVDVKNKRIDSARYSLLFAPRRTGSAWSISNIRRVEQLSEAGLMTEAGLARVTEAHENGQWEAAIRFEQTDLIPPELEKALRRRKGALTGYRSLTHSRKRQILRWLMNAKGEATRQRRIEAIVQEVAA
jgi:uncharacterized protein YdeI (YjbR/CyaY-like superfamily)